jgi:SAM-dependent methyltransferase
MRREALFSRSGFYGFLLQTNVLLHREAVDAAVTAFAPVLRDLEGSAPIGVLDLACGGWPVTISTVMEAFPEHHFCYTGVDINPDQVALAASTFAFPENVVETRLVEGNAWDLEALDLDGRWPLVFSGMNLHHGTHEEIAYLARELWRRLVPGGVFFSHDVFRPDETPYRPRPGVIDGQSSGLVDPACVAGSASPVDPGTRDHGTGEAPWREDYLARMRAALEAHGGDPSGIQSTLRHMRSRDFPVSTAEFCHLMERAGFSVRVHRYTGISGPLGPYIASCSAARLLGAGP